MLDRSTIKRLAVQVLSDSTGHNSDLEAFARAIEQAVRDEIDRLEIKPISVKQEPVAWCDSHELKRSLEQKCSFNGWINKYSDCDTPLYAAPATPDGMVMVPKEEYDDLLETKTMYKGLCK